MSFLEDAKAKGRITAESVELGAHVARMSEKAVAQLASEGEPDERCKTCAFRGGTPPNQCADTLLDALKCVVEGEPFYCHTKAGWPCHGWFAARIATRGAMQQAPWPFSHADAPPPPVLPDREGA